MECLNTSFYILFKRFLNISEIIYYIFDWSPKRYTFFLNKIYLILDKFATYYSNATWNIAYTIAKYKTQYLSYNKNKVSKQLYVPYSPYPFRAKSKIKKNTIVYAGGLIHENGAQLLIPILKEITKTNKKIKLIIMGEGELKEKILNEAKVNSLKNNIRYYGYISDENRVLKIQSQCELGIAPYPNTNETRKKFGDVIKIRMYIASGIPIITTNVPPIYREIEKEKIGIIIKSNYIKNFATKINELLKKQSQLKIFRKNILIKREESSWNKIYDKAIKHDKKLLIQL